MCHFDKVILTYSYPSADPLAVAGAANHLCKNRFQIWILLENPVHLVYNTCHLGDMKILIAGSGKVFCILWPNQDMYKYLVSRSGISSIRGISVTYPILVAFTYFGWICLIKHRIQDLITCIWLSGLYCEWSCVNASCGFNCVFGQYYFIVQVNNCKS